MGGDVLFTDVIITSEQTPCSSSNGRFHDFIQGAMTSSTSNTIGRSEICGADPRPPRIMLALAARIGPCTSIFSRPRVPSVCRPCCGLVVFLALAIPTRIHHETLSEQTWSGEAAMEMTKTDQNMTTSSSILKPLHRSRIESGEQRQRYCRRVGSFFTGALQYRYRWIATVVQHASRTLPR